MRDQMLPGDSNDDSSALQHQQPRNVPSRRQTTALDVRTASSNVLDRSSPYYCLPVELLAFILTLRFTSADGLPESFEMKELYRLRLVSRSWKELIEGTPTLWTYVSSDYPTVVVQDCVRWSKNHLLQIRFLDRWLQPVEALPEFLQLLQSHSHRWKTLVYSPSRELSIDPRHFLESPAPMLQSVDVDLMEFAGEQRVNLAGGMAKGLKHLRLENAFLPDYSNFLHGLETFSLTSSAQVQVGEILNIFVKSPALRRFNLHCNGAEDQTAPTTSAAHPLDPVANSLEEVVITVIHPQIIAHILSQVSMPNCKSLELSADFTPSGGNLPSYILDEALAQFTSRVREALSFYRRTSLLVESESEYTWSSSKEYEGFRFTFDWSSVTLENVIEWIRGLVGAAESQLELEIVLVTLHRETVETLGELNEVTKLDIRWMDSSYEDCEVVSLPNFLGDVLVNPSGGLSWNFPNLRELDVYYVSFELSTVFGIISRRYLPEAYVRDMEGLGISIQTPPKIDLRLRGTTDVGDVMLMVALKTHWGVRSLAGFIDC